MLKQYFTADTLTIITSVIAIIATIIALLKQYLKWKKGRNHEEDLMIFFGEEKNILDYTENYIRTMGVDRPPDDEDDYRDTQEIANRQDLIKFFFRQVFNNKSKKIYLILGDAGMGKTTFLINLFLEYSNKVFRKKFQIKYVALGDPLADEFIDKYKNDTSFYKDGSNTILLLDAFDEDPKAIENYQDRFNHIVTNCRTFGKVIITSRTQFFPEEDKERFTAIIPLQDKELSKLTAGKKYIAPFSDREIKKFLRHKYSWKFNFLGTKLYLNDNRKIAENICKKASNLVARPMLLDNIDIIINERKNFNYECEIYETLIQAWIKRESKKQQNRTNTKESFEDEMNNFISLAAKHAYENLQSGNGIGLYIEVPFLEDIAKRNDIHLDCVDLSTRSLLNRNSKGRFKFSHKTILEYLLAKFDSEAVALNHMINFQSFDFGLTIRNQLAFLQFNKDFKPVFYLYTSTYYSSSSFKKITMREIGRMDLVTAVIAINYLEIELRKMRIFENVKTIYNMKLVDCSDIQSIVLRTASTSDYNTFMDVEITYKSSRTVSSRTYPNINRNDSFFVDRAIQIVDINL